MPVSDDEKWTAVLRRDARFDSAFVYAVHSTGIYCRPSCPSRRPRREQVVFFGNAQAAEKAGFRPCLRCRPRSAAPETAMVERVCRYLESNLSRRVSLEELGSVAGVTPGHLQRTFKRLTGVSPRQYADARRLESVKAELRSGQPVATALYDAGYGSSSRLYERAPRLGMTPAAYRRGGEGMRIRFTTFVSPIGRVLLAGTERGVCAVAMGESDAELESEIRREFANADIERDDAGLAEWAAAVQRHLAGDQPRIDVPLDIRGTVFQCRVWEALRAIPYGETRSYTEVARSIGKAEGARAVARACATNPVAVVIPCHRVVREGGGLSGYRWGTERKRALLEKEASRANR